MRAKKNTSEASFDAYFPLPGEGLNMRQVAIQVYFRNLATEINNVYQNTTNTKLETQARELLNSLAGLSDDMESFINNIRRDLT